MSAKKVIVIDNPSNLPLIPMDQIRPFQGEFKEAPTEVALGKLMRSILDHHVFIAKAVFYEDGVPYTEDGHQTLRALGRLRDLGYTTSEVVSYELVDGWMQESGRERYEGLVIPCQVVVPQGDTPEVRRKDAAAKLLQINSQYAQVNPKTSFFEDLGFSLDEVDSLIAGVEVPNLDELVFAGREESEEEAFGKEMLAYNNANCLYPITPRFSEKYDAVLIVSDNQTDTAFLRTALQLRKEQSYCPKTGHQGVGMVITAKRFQELWKSR